MTEAVLIMVSMTMYRGESPLKRKCNCRWRREGSRVDGEKVAEGAS